eukprot:3687114-Prymnesium_polylepis.1
MMTRCAQSSEYQRVSEGGMLAAARDALVPKGAPRPPCSCRPVTPPRHHAARAPSSHARASCATGRQALAPAQQLAKSRDAKTRADGIKNAANTLRLMASASAASRRTSRRARSGT